MTYPADQKARAQAIALNNSFIVQAPAGSGKTELLIQRFLAALADCYQHPEEVLAITFTRKAAAEMRQRVINALLQAKNGLVPESKHAKITYQLAEDVLRKDQLLSWQLLAKQNRLCIMTIDALCSNIVSQSEQKIGQPHPAAKILYEFVVNDFVKDLIDSQDNDYKKCLLFFDHQPNWLQQLLCESLACRDQWLPLIFQESDPHAAALKYIDCIWQPLLNQLNKLEQSSEMQLLIECYLNIYNEISIDPKVHYKRIANILLTSIGEPRKSLSSRQGFSAPSTLKSDAEKQKSKLDRAKILGFAKTNVKLLKQVQIAPIIEDLESIKIIPTVLELLKRLVAYLKFHMQELETVDFIEQTNCTLRILQDSLDWPDAEGIPRPGNIRHLLLDEFQDTSKQQFNIIKSIIEHCDTSIRHSVFIVGDPMQSIYRFRQADVSLFYLVQKQGIAHLRPIPLTLNCNFRSSGQLVNYFNSIFANIFPNKHCAKTGAVSYSEATSLNQNRAEIEFQAFCNEEAQYQRIADICRANPDKHIGILVRSRLIANAVMPYLHDLPIIEHGLRALINEGEVQDLLAITNFIVAPYDKLAIANLMRSRIIGISLQNLYEALLQEDILSEIGKKSDQRMQTICQILQTHREFQLGQTISEQTLLLWQKLSPHASLTASQSSVSWQYFKHLETAEKVSPLAPLSVLMNLLQESSSEVKAGKIDIMTIHHAKGLEFDIVILPGLDRNSAARSGKILWWDAIDSGFLWLPNHPNQNKISSAHKYIYDLERQQNFQEQIRLLYVALTRAKSGLYCLANTGNYNNNSFAGLLHKWVEFQETSATVPELKAQATVEFLVTEPIFNAPCIQAYATTKDNLLRVLGVAYHYWLHLYFSKVNDLSQQTRWYLQEQNITRELIDEAMLFLEQNWPRVRQNTFFSWLARADRIWTEYSMHKNGKNIVIDACVFIAGECWLLDFKTNQKPSTENVSLWYQQTHAYRLILKTELACKINLLIYNPITDTVWIEQNGKFITADSNTYPS